MDIMANYDPEAREKEDLVRIEKLEAALRCVLLFYRGAYFTDSDRKEWQDVIGDPGVTTRAMCNHIRSVLSDD